MGIAKRPPVAQPPSPAADDFISGAPDGNRATTSLAAEKSTRKASRPTGSKKGGVMFYATPKLVEDFDSKVLPLGMSRSEALAVVMRMAVEGDADEAFKTYLSARDVMKGGY
jgi:hypothetical protein